MTAFTRYPTITVKRASPPAMGGALQARGQTGKVQHRALAQYGRIWTETYDLFRFDSVDGRGFVQMVNDFWRNGTVFTIDHPLYALKLGGGTGTVTVSGAGQTGSSIVTAGWGGTNPVLRRGDIIRIAGVPVVLDVAGDVNHSGGVATIPINPPIFVGGAPINGAAVTYSGLLFNASLMTDPQIPEADSPYLIAGARLVFQEEP